MEPTAYDRIRPEHRRRFLRICDNLNSLMRDILEYEPQACYYQQEDSLLLLVGPSHEGLGEPQQQNVALGVSILNSDGGGW